MTAEELSELTGRRIEFDRPPKKTARGEFKTPVTAGPRPATVSLAPGRPIAGRTCLTSHRATLLAGTKPHPNPIRSGYCNHQSRATRPPPSSPPRSNPHRPRSTPRFRALALLGRPPTAYATTCVVPGVRETCTKAEVPGVRQAAFGDRQFPAYTRPRPGKDLLRDCQF